MSATLNADQALRYARQIALPDWGKDGQARLAAARVLVVGLGGLGAPVIAYLAGAGVGTLTLNDFDRVDLSNLPRQPIYTAHAVGSSKVESAAHFIAQRNPDVQVIGVDRRLDVAQLRELVSQHDLVVDASDNFATRFDVNTACVQASKPLVSVAAIRYEGQLALFDPGQPGAPCYACLYRDSDDAQEDCVGQGVLTPLVGVMGSLAATEVVKWLLGQRATATTTTLHCFDARSVTMRSLLVQRDPGCLVCRQV